MEGAQTTRGGNVSLAAGNSMEATAEVDMSFSTSTGDLLFSSPGGQINLPATSGPAMYGQNIALQAGVDAIGAADFDNLLMIWNTSFGGGSDARIGVLNAIAETTNATATELEIGSSAFIALTDDSAYLFDCNIIARRTDVADECAAFNLTFAIRRGAGESNTVLMGTPTPTVIAADAGAAAWTCAVAADTTNGRPAITVTGEAAKTIRWNAQVMFSKVSG